MPQLNLRLTPEFERDLENLMVSARIMGKTAAVRFAVHEVAAAFQRREARENARPPQCIAEGGPGGGGAPIAPGGTAPGGIAPGGIAPGGIAPGGGGGSPGP